MQENRSIMWTPERLKALKIAHAAAVKQGKDAFVFDPQDGQGSVEFVTSYAKYLIEFLASKF